MLYAGMTATTLGFPNPQPFGLKMYVRPHSLNRQKVKWGCRPSAMLVHSLMHGVYLNPARRAMARAKQKIRLPLPDDVPLDGGDAEDILNLRVSPRRPTDNLKGKLLANHGMWTRTTEVWNFFKC